MGERKPMPEVLSEPALQTLGRIGIAMLLGGAVGLDRELAQKPAGLRTHMLVAGAATLLVSLSASIVHAEAFDLDPGLINADPIRIIEAVITGVSFLGAGTILRYGSSQKVEGLTTAASILMAAGLGIAVAVDRIVLAVGLTALVVMVLAGVGWLENRMSKNQDQIRNADLEKRGETDE
jgi:putative Mg2+ transporter-C (MgtC) family protein